MEMTIYVKGLRIEAHHGVMPQERIVGNTFEVDIELHTPATTAATVDDNLEGTINYAEVVETVRTEMATASQLLEHVAGRIRRALMQRWPQISGGTVRITKLTPPLGVELAGAGVALQW
jgi:dihydroneopterin aldolase